MVCPASLWRRLFAFALTWIKGKPGQTKLNDRAREHLIHIKQKSAPLLTRAVPICSALRSQSQFAAILAARGRRDCRVMRVLAAAFLYFSFVFGAGFLLGPIRVLWLEPLIGSTLAVLCEAPFLLAVMILAARWIPSAVRLGQDKRELILMGIVALGFQQAADLIVGTFLRAISPPSNSPSLPPSPG